MALANIIEELNEELNNSTLIEELNEDTNTSQLWHGTIDLHLVSIDQNERGAYLLTFANNDGEVMPGQFEGQFGNIYLANKDRLIAWLKNMKIALHLPSTLKVGDVISELEKPHKIYLAVKTSMKSWGLSQYNVVDFAQTMTL